MFNSTGRTYNYISNIIYLFDYVTGMIKVSCFISSEGCINNKVLIGSKHITVPKARFFIYIFPAISYSITNFFSYVFYNYIIFLEAKKKYLNC